MISFVGLYPMFDPMFEPHQELLDIINSTSGANPLVLFHFCGLNFKLLNLSHFADKDINFAVTSPLWPLLKTSQILASAVAGSQVGLGGFGALNDPTEVRTFMGWTWLASTMFINHHSVTIK